MRWHWGLISEPWQRLHHYAQKVVTGELPFLLTSCCPSWSLLAKKHFPDLVDSVSQGADPYGGNRPQHQAEASGCPRGVCRSLCVQETGGLETDSSSDVDFVITFEELVGMFEAKGIDLEEMEPSGGNFAMNDATAAGRGYAVAGGVAEAIRQCPGRVLSGCTGSYRTRGGTRRLQEGSCDGKSREAERMSD